MRRLILGSIVGLVIGVVLGATIIAPRLKFPAAPQRAEAGKYNLTEIKKRPGVRETLKSVPQKKLVRWRVASTYGSALPQLGELGVRLENTISDMSDGKFWLKLHEPGTLVQNNQIFDAVRSKTIDAAFGPPTYWANKNAAFQLYYSVP